MNATPTPRSDASESLLGILRSWTQGFETTAPARAPAPPRTLADAATSLAATGTSTRRRSAEPDSRGTSTAADVAAEDWDLLFRAALELLARVAAEKPTRRGNGVRLQAPGTALHDCLEALDQLRRSAPSAGKGRISNASVCCVEAVQALEAH